jgi:uncharacterized protein YndB with AHSA1/START domain
MASFQQSIDVSASPEAAYQYLADLTKHPEWAAHKLEVEPASGGPAAAGSTYSAVGHEMGTHRATVKVTELRSPERIAYEAEDDTGHFRHWISISAARDGGAEITKGVEPLRTNLMLTLLKPLMPMMVSRGLKGDLRRIKERLEAQG